MFKTWRENLAPPQMIQNLGKLKYNLERNFSFISGIIYFIAGRWTFLKLGVNVRFISDEEVLVAVYPGKILKVNIKTKKSQIIFEGKDFEYSFFTFWAKSDNYIAAKFSKSKLKILDPQFKQIAELEYSIQIEHVLYLSKDLFLILGESSVFKVSGKSPRIKKIKLDETPEIIFSGTSLERDYFFLHVKMANKNHEGRVYDLKGNLFSQKNIPKSVL